MSIVYGEPGTSDEEDSITVLPQSAAGAASNVYEALREKRRVMRDRQVFVQWEALSCRQLLPYSGSRLTTVTAAAAAETTLTARAGPVQTGLVCGQLPVRFRLARSLTGLIQTGLVRISVWSGQ